MEKLEKLENLYQEFWEDELKKKGMHNPAKFIDTQPFMYRSKELGFIKWLVENDKIELHELSKKELATGWSLENNILDEKNTKESWIKFWTENLLMILAISDTPIDDLISYLK